MSEEKETKNVVEETVDKVVDSVKEGSEKVVDTGKEVVETVKEKVEDVVDAVKAPARSKKATWWNRIWSAIVGAILAVASMFGITTVQIDEQKAKTKEVKATVSAAIEDIKAGKVAEAKAKLESAVATTKEVVAEAKEIVEKGKNANIKEVKEKAVEGATQALKKTTEKIENLKKPETTKK